MSEASISSDKKRPRILFINSDEPDYLQDLTHSGLLREEILHNLPADKLTRVYRPTFSRALLILTQGTAAIKGYQVQIMETYSTDKEKDQLSALIPAIEDTSIRDLKPAGILADSLYGGDENCEQAKELGVEVISPTMGSVKNTPLTLNEFPLSILALRLGIERLRVRGLEAVSLIFSLFY